mgnify:CR=1 FL=1
MKQRTVFDIETGPLPTEEIKRIAPPFNEDDLKMGNLGLEKQLEKIHLARSKHIEGIESKAALNAEYGQVLAIGLQAGSMSPVCLIGEESEIISQFWDYAAKDYQGGQTVWIGFNSNSFDLPFLLRRSFILGIRVPRHITPMPRYWDSTFWIDLMDNWKAGDFRATISLDRFCKASGLEGKNGSGKYFSQLLKEDKDKAIEYLKNDIAITAQLAERVLGCFQQEGKK